MTASIQPPAARVGVADRGRRPGARCRRSCATTSGSSAHRDLDGDGLIWIVQPDESGLDASPQFDPIWGRRAHGLPASCCCVRRNRRLGFDLRRIADAGGPVCCEVMTNVLYGAVAAGARPAVADAARSIERMYDERPGLFWPLARPAPARRPPLTWAALAPLALPDLPEQIGRRLVEEHLLDRARFWLPVPPPSVSADRSGFSIDDSGRSADSGATGAARRGSTRPGWCGSGCVRLGYDEQARELAARRSARPLGTRAGCASTTTRTRGRGMGARRLRLVGAGWCDMLAPDPRAAVELPRSCLRGVLLDRGGVAVERALDLIACRPPEARRTRA